MRFSDNKKSEQILPIYSTNTNIRLERTVPLVPLGPNSDNEYGDLEQSESLLSLLSESDDRALLFSDKGESKTIMPSGITSTSVRHEGASS